MGCAVARRPLQQRACTVFERMMMESLNVNATHQGSMHATGPGYLARECNDES